jgi:biopolymer transport protein TolR
MPRNRKSMSQINVVPMIDVMLVLLVVFMVTAPFINPGQVKLPSVAQTSTSPTPPIEVIVDEDGTLALRDRGGDNRKRDIGLPELGSAVRGIQLSRPDTPVVIAADKTVRYEKVMDVMAALQRAEVERIGLLARSTR